MKRSIALFIILTLLICAVGCAPLPEPADTFVAAMDTEMTLRLYGDTDGSAAKYLTAELFRLDAVFSPTEESSTLYSLNRFKTIRDADILSLLQTADEISARTNGALDVTLLPLSRLWGFIGASYYLPTADEIAETSRRTGTDKYEVVDDSVRLKGDAELDFGALAKGYAADVCRAYLEGLDMPALLTLGGNVQSVGDKPGGEPWMIGIQDPRQPEACIMTLALRGTNAVVTSGDYQRCFDLDGVRYCHIIDPATGSPVQNDLCSVTIVADSGVLADGLSTALFVMGPDAAFEHWRQSDDFEAVFVLKDGTVYVTEGLKGAVRNCNFEVVSR